MNTPARALSTVVAAVMATGVCSLPAMAGGGPECARKAMLMQDVEGGGQLTAAAHVAGATKRFETMDANKDGKITGVEIDGSHGAESIVWANERHSAAEKIKTLDADNDGALTSKEYADGSQKMFDELDVDGDGVLSAAEVQVPTKVSAR